MNTLKTCNKITLPTWWQNKIEYIRTMSYGMIHFAEDNHSQFYTTLEVKTRKNGKGRWCKPFNQHRSTISQQQPELAELVRFDGWTQEGLFPSYLEAGISFYQSYTDEARYFRRLTLLEESEDIPTFDTGDTSELTNWLEARKPLIKERFHSTMSKFNVEYIKETIVEIEHRNYYARSAEQKKSAAIQKADTFDEDCRQKSRQIQEARKLQESKRLEAILESFDNDGEKSVDALNKFNNDDDFFNN